MDNRKRIFSYVSLVCINLGFSEVYAADFYTIIGPDGRPMIVQQQESKPNKENIKPKGSVENEPSADKQLKAKENRSNTTAANSKNQQGSESDLKDQTELTRVKIAEQRFSNVDQSKQIKQTTSITPVQDKTKKIQVEKPAEQEPVLDDTAHKDVELESTKKSHSSVPTKVTEVQPREASLNKVTKNRVTQNKVTQNKVTQNKVSHHEAITKIDGVEYVDNEYLEDREFNLEGKKRFYIMPDSSVGGTRRFETVEREKGISKSVFSKLTQNSPEKSEPVVLSSTYYRLPKNEVVQSLEQTCFEGKKINKAKLLSLDKNEMGVWPVPPIKEKFVYDVIKLDPSVENIHFTSYASSQKSPSYYWPLVVFLDQKGCVIEGVSGFKNENIDSTSISYSALEGVLKKPTNAVYLFMTPLSEAVDVQNVQLTNTGQIKLSVLR